MPIMRRMSPGKAVWKYDSVVVMKLRRRGPGIVIQKLRMVMVFRPTMGIRMETTDLAAIATAPMGSNRIAVFFLGRCQGLENFSI